MKSYLVRLYGYQTDVNPNGQTYVINPQNYQEEFSVITSSPRLKDLRPTPLEFYRVRFKTCQINCARLNNGRKVGEFYGNSGFYPVASTVGQFQVDANVYNSALSKLNEKVRGELDHSINLGQSKQIGGMFSDFYSSVRRLAKEVDHVVRYVKKFDAVSLARSYRGYKRALARGISPKRAAKGVGSKWLEYQYGLKPLISDVYGTVDEIIKGGSRPLVVFGRHTDIFATDTVRSGSIAGLYTATYPCRYEYSSRCHVEVRMKLRDTFVQALSRYSSLNPASIAWELLPYSFVVDWFVDIGGYIRNLETAYINQIGFDSGFVVHTKIFKATCTAGTYVNVGPTNDQFVGTLGSGYQSNMWKKRVVLTSYPSPKLPRFEAVLGSGRLLNAAALLSQHLR